MAQLAVYFDVGKAMMSLPKGVPTWGALTPAQWDDLFSPALHMTTASPSATAPAAGGRDRREGSTGAWASLLALQAGSQIFHHDFLLAPVSASLRYTRPSKRNLQQLRAGGKQGEVAAQEWSLSLGEVAVHLSASQYSGAQALAGSLDTAMAAAPHHHMRPRCRPRDGGCCGAEGCGGVCACGEVVCPPALRLPKLGHDWHRNKGHHHWA